MNTNLRAILFAVSVTAVLTIAIDNVVAAETTPVYRLDAIEITAHRDNFDSEGALKTVHLEPVFVTGHKAVAE